MKMCSLKTLAVWLTISITTSFMPIIALDDFKIPDTLKLKESCCLSRPQFIRRVNHVDQLLSIIFANLDNVYTYQGAFENPNILTSPAISGEVTTNRAHILVTIADFIEVLRKLGVHLHAREVIQTQMVAFVDAALNYSLVVNLANTGQSSDDQTAVAGLLENAANALGVSFFALTGNPQFPGIWSTIATLTTQVVQANRLVLEDSNEFNAKPAFPATESSAAIHIAVEIQRLVHINSILLVVGLVDEACSCSR